MTSRSLGVVVVALALAGCAGGEPSGGADLLDDRVAAPRPLQLRALQGRVVRMGTIRGQPLYGVHLRAFVCSRSRAEADQTYPTAFRIGHYVTSGRTASDWGKPFRVLVNDLHWLVPLGETRRVCGEVEFEDVIPPENYGGLESPLGLLGYSRAHRCYGVRLTLWAALVSGRTTSKRISASKRAIVQCGRFRPS